MRPTTNIPNIIFEDQDLIVLDKPAGFLVHQAESTKPQATLVDFLLNNYPELKNIGEDPERPGLVHRLDKDTSGVMVVAHNHASYDYLKKLFKDRRVTKKYQALVFGTPDQDDFLIDMPIKRTAKGTFGARHASDVAKLKPALGSQYRPAQTLVKVDQRFKDFALVEAYPKTGRTHQIRVHLKALGYPIVGDQLYSSVKQRQMAEKKWDLKRQFLHATSLTLNHPKTDKAMTFEAPLPTELHSVLKEIQSHEK